jgi:hypothetical protein
LLAGYVNRQLDRRQRAQVVTHLKRCADCRSALRQEKEVAQELTAYMPRIGQSEPGQLRHLWPKIRTEAFGVPARGYAYANQTAHTWSSLGVIGGALLIASFALSALFGGPTYVNAAPNQSVPSDIQATNTPVRTDAPGALSTLAALITPPPSRTAASATEVDNYGVYGVPGSPIAAPAPRSVRWSH